MKLLVSLVSLIAFLLVALAGPLYRLGVIELSTSFSSFEYGVYVAIAALVLFAIQVLFKRKTITLASAAMAVLLPAVAIAVPLSMMNKGKSVPAIHDISTDMINPPQFIAIAPLRADAPNPVIYAGETTAAQQRQAYPAIKALSYAQPKADLILAVEQVVRNLEWTLINVDAGNGIIEATDTTTWFGFKDDVVVRVSDEGSERIIDVRSKSRVGSSDLGKNAERIGTFIEELNTVLDQ